MKKILTLIVLSSFLALTSCATLVNGTYQNLTIDTPSDDKNTTYSITSNNGNWTLPPGQHQITVPRSMRSLTITRHSPDGTTIQKRISSTLNPWTLFNPIGGSLTLLPFAIGSGSGGGIFLAGGAVYGLLLGIPVDLISGAAFSYPKNITL